MGNEQDLNAGQHCNSQPSDKKLPFIQVLSILLTGLGIGWLCGLSKAPVIAGVISSLLGVAVCLVSIFGGVTAGKLKIGLADARPVAFLVVGIATGASIGLFARTHNILSPPQVVTTDKLSMAQLPPDQQSTHLFALPGSDDCAELLNQGPNQIRMGFRSSKNPRMRLLGDLISSDQDLVHIAEVLCAE